MQDAIKKTSRERKAKPMKKTEIEKFELTVIIVSYNTRNLTLRAIETLYKATYGTRFDCIVVDNASTDGTVDAISLKFPQVMLIASKENMGFAHANNFAAKLTSSPYILLLNPDTETFPGAIDQLMNCAKRCPHAGIWGGRTVFPDGELNIASCWASPSLRGLFFRAVGLTSLFPKSEFFNPESYGNWRRDSERKVDIVVGCFLLIKRSIWEKLEGFNLKYYMYGEDADLCLRAKADGWLPMITPRAEIMHIVGASTSQANDRKAIMVMKSRVSLIKDHWPTRLSIIGIFFMWLWAAIRYVGTRPLTLSTNLACQNIEQRWAFIWSNRKEWLKGY